MWCTKDSLSLREEWPLPPKSIFESIVFDCSWSQVYKLQLCPRSTFRGLVCGIQPCQPSLFKWRTNWIILTLCSLNFYFKKESGKSTTYNGGSPFSEELLFTPKQLLYAKTVFPGFLFSPTLKILNWSGIFNIVVFFYIIFVYSVVRESL